MLIVNFQKYAHPVSANVFFIKKEIRNTKEFG